MSISFACAEKGALEFLLPSVYAKACARGIELQGARFGLDIELACKACVAVHFDFPVLR